MAEMTDELRTQLNDVLAKHVSGLLAGQLRDVLDSGEKAKAEVKKLEQVLFLKESLVKTAQSELNKALEQLKAHGLLADREAAIVAKEHAVQEKERDLRVVAAEINSAASLKIADAMQATLMGLVRNTEFRTTMHETVSNKAFAVEGHPGGNGSYPSPGYVAHAPSVESTTVTKSNTAA